MFNEEKKIRARVILADDHPEVIKYLREALEREFEVVATVGDGNALVAAAETLAPDVIVTDIAMVYQQCGSTWYQPQGSQYVVVNPPY